MNPGSDKDFIVWFSDPRMGVNGVLIDMLFGVGGTTAGNFLLDLLAGPILCNIGPFSVDASNYLLLNESRDERGRLQPRQPGDGRLRRQPRSRPAGRGPAPAPEPGVRSRPDLPDTGLGASRDHAADTTER